MCPFCFSTMAMVLAGVASGSGVAALVFKTVRAHDDAETLNSQSKGEENATENCLAW